MWIILFLFLINQLARHPVSEEFIAQRCNLITCSKHIAQIIASMNSELIALAAISVPASRPQLLNTR